MGDLSEHFSRHEFKCKCGCGRDNISMALVERLENVFDYLKKCERGCKYIIITSGIRCPSYSVKVGGTATDAHTQSIAADFYVVGDDGKRYPAEQVAAVCELYGFGGIGVGLHGDPQKTCVHADVRDHGGYVNNHWYGNETTGENISTFAAHIPPAKIINRHKISVFLDGKEIMKGDVNL